MLKPRFLLPSGLARYSKTRSIGLMVVEMVLVMAVTVVVMAIVATAIKIALITKIAIVVIATRRRVRGTVIVG